MPIYEWKRPMEATLVEDGLYEYELTTTMDPPPGEGWTRVYSFGVGAVKGAGLSPSRQVSGH